MRMEIKAETEITHNEAAETGRVAEAAAGDSGGRAVRPSGPDMAGYPGEQMDRRG